MNYTIPNIEDLPKVKEELKTAYSQSVAPIQVLLRPVFHAVAHYEDLRHEAEARDDLRLKKAIIEAMEDLKTHNEIIFATVYPVFLNCLRANSAPQGFLDKFKTL